MRRFWLPLAAGAAFLAGTRFAGAKDDTDVVGELVRRQQALFADLEKIEQAARDIVEIRDMRASGQYVLNDEERKMERKGRTDFHIFMERCRNDTLETLAILDRATSDEHFVEPVRRMFGKALDEVVAVDWEERDLEDVIADLEAGYGVRMNVSGDLDYRKTLSLRGEMSLLSILLYIENVFDAKLVLRDGHLWFMRIERKAPPPKPDGE